MPVPGQPVRVETIGIAPIAQLASDSRHMFVKVVAEHTVR
jgi:hypothetical protein